MVQYKEVYSGGYGA